MRMQGAYLLVAVTVAGSHLMHVAGISWPLSFPEATSRRAGPVQHQAASGDKPWFCHNNECPEFEVLKKASKYEVRSYKEGDKWIATDTSGLIYGTAVGTGYKRLYQFTDGANDKDIKVPLTSPVLTRIRPGSGVTKSNNYTIALWLPAEFQDEPPRPTDSEVEIVTPPSGKVVYVLQFGGYLVDDITVDTHASKLKQALLEDRIEFDESQFFTATYDGAVKPITGRHNELWYAGDKSDSPAA